jgi:hypothetical protein
LVSLVLRRGTSVVKPPTQSLDSGGGSFIFDFAAFAPSSPVTLDMVGKSRTVSCVLDTDVLGRLR